IYSGCAEGLLPRPRRVSVDNRGVPDDADWRLRGQEHYLQGATLVRKPYHARSEEWEHDHCEFCWTKFMDPSFSSEHARYAEHHPDVLVEGYAVQGGRPLRLGVRPSVRLDRSRAGSSTNGNQLARGDGRAERDADAGNAQGTGMTG